MKTIEKVKIGSAVFAVIVILLFLHHVLPRTAVVQITGTDVKRHDRSSGKIVETTAGGRVKEKTLSTQDVRYINSLSRKGKTMVFRNEDTGWGWPPYFKFDSADLTARAQAFAADQDKQWVIVKYYGWRIKIFSMFPNAVTLKQVNRNYSHFPLFNIAFFIALAILAFFLRSKYKALMDWLNNRKKK